MQTDAPSPANGDRWAPAQPDGATELAFQGNLIPLRAADEQAPSERTEPQARQTVKSATSTTSLPAASAGSESESGIDPVEAPEAVRRRQSDAPEPSLEERLAVPAARVRKPESSPAPQAEAAAPESGALSVHPSPDRAPGQFDHTPTPPKPEPAEGRMEPPTPPAPAAPRDIKLEVTSGGQRVEVLVADRGGDVHVAVRTSDSHLAGALRDDLPALSSRLEQTGLRAEAWHTPAPAGGDWRRDGDRQPLSSSRDSAGQPGEGAREQPGGGQRRQSPETEERVYEEQPPRKEKGKEFAWFMSSLR